MRPTLGPKERLSRRVGQNLFLKGERSYSQKHAMIRNPFPPGPRRKRRRKAISDYGQHLVEKQKLRYSYGIPERQLRRYFEESLKSVGNTAEALFQKLESRLDNVVFRAGFIISRTIARQLVSHGHISVNGKKVNLPSYSVKPGDVIAISERSSSLSLFKDLPTTLKNYTPPAWLEVKKDKYEAKVLALPTTGEVSDQFNLQAVVEFYSR